MPKRSLVKPLVSVVALAGVAWWASRQKLPTLPHDRATIVALVASLALYVVATLARGERWHRVLRLTGTPTRRRTAYEITTVGYMANNALPARAGDLLKAYLTEERAHVGYRQALGAVIAERLLDIAALALLFGILAVTLVPSTGVPLRGWLIVAGAVAALLALAGIVALTSARARRVARRAVDGARALARPARALLSARGAGLLVLSVAIWTVEAAVYSEVARSAGIGLGFLNACYVVAFVNLVGVVPAGPGYVGTFDAAVVFAARALGAARRGVLGYVLLLRFVLFLPITAVGAVIFFARYGGYGRYVAARRAAQARADTAGQAQAAQA